MADKEILTVGDLIDALSRHPREAPLSLSVGWAGDTAVADRGEVSVKADRAAEGGVRVSGWLSNCGTELEYEDEA